MAMTVTTMKLIELVDCKIYELTADPSTGSPTYSTPGIDIPGITKIKVTPKMETKELKGDSVTIDSFSRVTGVDIEVDAGMFDLKALPILIGGGYVAGANDVTFSMNATSAGTKYFKIIGRWTYVNDEAKDAHMILYKCKVTDAPAFEINDASGNFGTVSFKASAVACMSNGKWYDIVFNDKLTPLT